MKNPSKIKEPEREQNRELPPNSTESSRILRKAMLLLPGEKTLIEARESEVRAAIPDRIRSRKAMFHIKPIAGAIEVQRLHWVDEPPSTRARIAAMQPGDTLRFDAKISTVRSTASQVSTGTGLRYTVRAEPAGGVAVWCRDEADAAAGKARTGPAPRYPFDEQAPGTAFTVPAGEHAGIAAMRTQCARHGSRMRLVFQARENINGSVTVRCWAIGGMPPKWAIDRDHAEVQEAIQRQQHHQPQPHQQPEA